MKSRIHGPRANRSPWAHWEGGDSRTERKRKAPRCPRLRSETPHQRVAELERLARASKVLGADLPFDDCVWDVTRRLHIRKGCPARKGSLRLRIDKPMGPVVHRIRSSLPAGGFARAYLRFTIGLGYDALRQRSLMLQYVRLEIAAVGSDSIAAVNWGILEAAAKSIGEDFCATAADKLCYQLETFAKFVASKGIANPELSWWRRPSTNLEAEEWSVQTVRTRAAEKLPSQKTLDALTLAFKRATHVCDIITTRVAALASAVPCRANEELALREDCAVELDGPDDSIIHGLRWTGSKGYSCHIKVSANAMVPVVKACIERLLQVTEDGRRIKRHYDDETKRGRLFLPIELEHLRGAARLAEDDLATLLGIWGYNNLYVYVTKYRLADVVLKKMTRCTGRVSFASLERHMLGLLPRLMDDAGGPTYHPLLVVNWGLFYRRSGPPSPCMFQVVHYHHIRSALAPTSHGRSVFQRTGVDPEGLIKLSHHQLRHWLNDLLQKGGASQVDIAIASGRGLVASNAAYDHGADAIGDDVKAAMAEGVARRRRARGGSHE